MKSSHVSCPILALVVLMNLTAIIIRRRLRRTFAGAAV